MLLKEAIKIEVDTSEVDALLEKLKECERLIDSIELKVFTAQLEADREHREHSVKQLKQENGKNTE